MQIHIRLGKNGKDRIVPLSKNMAYGLKKYLAACHPKVYVFNGQQTGSPMSQRGMQWAMREAVKKAEILKRCHLHTLRHSYATHLLEDGLDVYTVSKLMGHEHIQTTLDYLHVANRAQSVAHSPFDTLYKKNENSNENEKL